MRGRSARPAHGTLAVTGLNFPWMGPSVVDTAPYGRWQNYRLPYSWKLDDPGGVQLSFVDGEVTLQRLLQATASWVGESGVNIHESHEGTDQLYTQASAVLNMLQLDGGMGAVRGSEGDFQIKRQGKGRCPFQQVCHLKGALSVTSEGKSWTIRCTVCGRQGKLPTFATQTEGCVDRVRSVDTGGELLGREVLGRGRDIDKVRQIWDLDWVDSTTIDGLVENTLWQHEVIWGQGAWDILDGNPNRAVPAGDIFFLGAGSRDTSPPFFAEVDMVEGKITVISPGGAFKVGQVVAQWVKAERVPAWRCTYNTEWLCRDPRNREVLNWANMVRRDRGLELLDGEFEGVIRLSAAGVWARSWLAGELDKVEGALEPSLRLLPLGLTLRRVSTQSDLR